jgi:hypothetical protein
MIDERKAAVEAILEAGHIPAGMELFTAGNINQWDLIKRWIQESDVYLLMAGGRYGSLFPGRTKSYTELEFEYAKRIKKPMFSIVASQALIDQKIAAHLVPNSGDDFDNAAKFRARAGRKSTRYFFRKPGPNQSPGTAGSSASS